MYEAKIKKKKNCRNKELNKEINLIYFLNKLKNCSDICKKASLPLFFTYSKPFSSSFTNIMVQKKLKFKK